MFVLDTYWIDENKIKSAVFKTAVMGLPERLEIIMDDDTRHAWQGKEAVEAWPRIHMVLKQRDLRVSPATMTTKAK